MSTVGQAKIACPERKIKKFKKGIDNSAKHVIIQKLSDSELNMGV